MRVNGVEILEPKKTPLEIADEWAFFTISIWREKMVKYKVGLSTSGNLERSFLKEVIGTPGGGLISINFSFKYYGKFVDMGVGKGTKLGDVGQNKTSRYLEGKMIGNRRIPKKWYSKTLFAETATLKEILSREYAFLAGFRIVENIGDNSIR